MARMVVVLAHSHTYIYSTQHIAIYPYSRVYCKYYNMYVMYRHDGAPRERVVPVSYHQFAKVIKTVGARTTIGAKQENFTTANATETTIYTSLVILLRFISPKPHCFATKCFRFVPYNSFSCSQPFYPAPCSIAFAIHAVCSVRSMIQLGREFI